MLHVPLPCSMLVPAFKGSSYVTRHDASDHVAIHGLPLLVFAYLYMPSVQGSSNSDGVLCRPSCSDCSGYFLFPVLCPLMSSYEVLIRS